MIIFLKKYWTHILNLSLIFLLLCIFLLLGNNLSGKIVINYSTLIIMLILEGIMVLGIWVEIILYFIHAIKNKEAKNNALCAVFCYLFNVFYIPCYCLKYVSKDKNYKTKNIIYLIVSILLYLSLIPVIVLVISRDTNSYNFYGSPDGEIIFKMPSNYEKIKDIGEYDVYFSNIYANVGVFIYDNYNVSAEEVLNSQESQIKNSRDDVRYIDSNNKITRAKTIKNDIYEGIYKGEKYIYSFSVITYTKKPNYIVYVIEMTPKENYNSNKKELKQIIENIDLKMKKNL